MNNIYISSCQTDYSNIANSRIIYKKRDLEILPFFHASMHCNCEFFAVSHQIVHDALNKHKNRWKILKT